MTSAERRPVIWALYTERWKAINAMETERFGPGPWSVRHHPEHAPYVWALIWEANDEGVIEEWTTSKDR